MKGKLNPPAYQARQLYLRSLRLLEGDGVARDEVASFDLNRGAAELGHHDATLAMGWFYLNGIGVAEDWEQAWTWYRKSARQGDERAMFSLGQISYARRDYGEAHRWFTRAIDAGHTRSMYWLGKLCWKGHGVEQDRERARALFERAAEAKVPEAQRIVRALAVRQRSGVKSHDGDRPHSSFPGTRPKGAGR